MTKNMGSFEFKKKYGQNFIKDENILNSIIRHADIDKDTLVIEIGPGSGALTLKIAPLCMHIICYEIDESLKPILDEKICNYSNVSVIYKDFLESDIKSDIKKYNYKKIYVIANLPYYITTPIIMKLLESSINIDKIVIMVQKEVGDRLKAKPNTKEYGSLTVFLNYFYNIKKIIDVSRNVFYPKPNVDSIVIELTNRYEKPFVKNEELFFKLIKDSFRYKRKTLKNNLKDYDLNKVLESIKAYGYDLSVRAEALPMEVFVNIANNLE